MFLTDNLWKIFEVAKEERTDGDNFQGDMGVADDLFINAVRGNEHFDCLDKYDMVALAKGLETANLAKAKVEYDALVGNVFVQKNDVRYKEVSCYKELTAAFTANDPVKFNKVRDEHLAIYNKLEAETETKG